MRALIYVQQGMEEVARDEILELLPRSKPEVRKQLVLFEARDRMDIVRVAYRSLCAIRCMEVVEDLKVDQLDDFKIQPQLYVPYLQTGSMWAVRCKYDESAGLTRQDIEQEAGAILHEHLTTTALQAKVNLTKPDVLFLVVLIDGHAFVGVDYAGVDLTKRDYKIFSAGQSLAGSTARGFVALAGFDPKEITLDPFSHDGTIAIEMAYTVTKMPPLFYKKDSLQFMYAPFLDKAELDKTLVEIEKEIIHKKMKGTIHAFGGQLRHLKTSQKNAKIAGVLDDIHFSKVEVRDLELKFKEGTVDRIITMPPNTSVEFDDKRLEKLYVEFFYQAEFVLTKKGVIVTISGKRNFLEAAAKKYGYSIAWEKTIYQGKLAMPVLYFTRDKKSTATKE